MDLAQPMNEARRRKSGLSHGGDELEPKALGFGQDRNGGNSESCRLGFLSQNLSYEYARKFDRRQVGYRGGLLGNFL